MTGTPTLKQRICERGPLFGCWLEMCSARSRPTPGRSVEERVAAGDDLIVVDADVLLLRDAARASLTKLRAEN